MLIICHLRVRCSSTRSATSISIGHCLSRRFDFIWSFCCAQKRSAQFPYKSLHDKNAHSCSNFVRTVSGGASILLLFHFSFEANALTRISRNFPGRGCCLDEKKRCVPDVTKRALVGPLSHETISTRPCFHLAMGAGLKCHNKKSTLPPSMTSYSELTRHLSWAVFPRQTSSPVPWHHCVDVSWLFNSTNCSWSFGLHCERCGA